MELTSKVERRLAARDAAHVPESATPLESNLYFREQVSSDEQDGGGYGSEDYEIR